MSLNGLKISLLIPTLNAGKQWVKLLESVEDQSTIFYKKIIIDSGSTDETVKLALANGFEVSLIAKQDFNHGKVRQDLVNLAEDTDICVFLTQDAILASPDSIENLVKAFDDPCVGLAYGRQLPHLKARPLETHLRLFNYPAVSEVLSVSDVANKGFKVFFCSNSFSAYRRTALNSVGGFPSDSIMGEDAIVAAKMLMSGLKKAYVADAVVYHSHSYKIDEEFKRYFDTRVFHEQNKWLIQKYGKPTGEGLRYIRSELTYAMRNDVKSILKSITSIGAKWLGYRSGKYYKVIRPGILKRISMHKAYWKE
jgi:rhamnosyltransferase